MNTKGKETPNETGMFQFDVTQKCSETEGKEVQSKSSGKANDKV